MRSLRCHAFGGPDTLTLDEIDPPAPNRGEVRLKILASGVNFPDLLVIQGKYQLRPPFPFAPGSEVAGEVEAVGEGVEGWSVGDRAVATIPWGGFAEAVCAPVDALVPMPDGMTPHVAAGFLLTYATSQHALVDRGQLQAGETLLVLGAAGGVGLAAVQIGKALGARVIAAASTPEKLETCRGHGADEVIDYSSEDLKARVKALTGGAGADVVYDPVGGDYAEPALRATAWAGRYLVVGFAAGEIPKIPLNLTLLKGCAIVGVFWGAFAARHPDRHRAHVEQLVAWAAEGRIQPHVSKVYGLAEAPQALVDLAERRVQGKVVIDPAAG